MSTLAQLMEVKSEKLLKTQGDSDGVIPDSDQEEKLNSPYNKETPKSTIRPKKRLRFSGMNQVCYYQQGSKRDMSPSQTRQTLISTHSILKNKESPIFLRENK
ncbi:unnamed protein product [Paramecium primaurelia]|uniref:Uncharacterized protein n=2 Tax=Paramecium TaxID=5884 RepID=A0A8S1X5N9_9CILI|nr:unnamed protein product [Paramecium primaurelia]CAD8196092.1 unnamed protein product [Paramecium pentaurelia]